MYISPVGFYNNFKQNSAFKGLFTNPDKSIVSINPRYIEQAETMRYIRNTVDEAMEECPDDILNNARDTIDGRLLYFTIDRNGKCVISNEEFPPCYL